MLIWYFWIYSFLGYLLEKAFAKVTRARQQGRKCFLLLPLCVNGALARTWYVQVPAAAAWIPWVLAAASVWRLWTAGEKVEREHRDLMCDRMSGASLFLLILSLVSAVGAAVSVVRIAPAREDWLVLGCMVCAAVCSVVLFARRKDLSMIEVENPEKPQAKKK